MNRQFWFLLLIAPAFAQPPGGGAQGDGIWLRNAYFGEAESFDGCTAHQPQNGQYHYHANPVCLRAQLNDSIQVVRTGRNGPVYTEKAAPWTHSPILGWAFDGNPIYGPYGYSDPKSSSSAIKRMKSSFRLRNVTDRTSLPDWALPLHTGVAQQLAASQYGPKISVEYPLGRYLEDYDYVSGLGDLDQYNGRFAVTPDYPQGVYAYYITLDDKGAPAFPYILSGQYYGTVSGGNARAIPDGTQDYFNAGAQGVAPSNSPALITGWLTKNSQTAARVTTGYDPAAGPKTTWPSDVPAGVQISGGVATPTPADVQRVRYSDTTVYVNSNNLASHVMGPWFTSGMTGGVFGNYPSSMANQVQFPRNPGVATSKTNTGLGAQGILVNGVAIFNALDGASYSNARGADGGGPNVTPNAVHLPAATGEKGPVAPGSLVTAYAQYGASLATSTGTAPTTNWPTTLGGATVTVRDSAGASRAAAIYYASPAQINYLLPADTATGFGSVSIQVGGSTYSGNINVAASYPGLFFTTSGGLAAAYITRIHNGQQSTESLGSSIDLGSSTDQVYLIVYGSGLGNGKTATATIGGMVTDVVYAGPQGVYSGLDQYNILIPRALAGMGKVDVVVTAGGKSSNAVNVSIQ